MFCWTMHGEWRDQIDNTNLLRVGKNGTVSLFSRQSPLSKSRSFLKFRRKRVRPHPTLIGAHAGTKARFQTLQISPQPRHNTHSKTRMETSSFAIVTNEKTITKAKVINLTLTPMMVGPRASPWRA